MIRATVSERTQTDLATAERRTATFADMTRAMRKL